MAAPLRTFQKLGGSAALARGLAGQRRFAYLPPEQLVERRDRNVRRLVRFAAATVPFYRDWFHQQGLDPGAVEGADDLHLLPVVDKQTLRREGSRLVSESREGRATFPMQTSGSSGLPLTVRQSRGLFVANATAGVREQQALQEALPPGVPLRIGFVGYPGNASDQVRGRLRELAFVPRGTSHERIHLFEPLETIIAELDRLRPTVLMAYGSFIELLFRTAKTRGLDLYRPAVALTVADQISPEGRRVAEEDFGVRVLSKYSAVEALRIGFTCREATGFHLHEDLVHVRVVDDLGNDLPVGETGEVLVSNLVNHGTVILNYRLGDIGSLAGRRSCDCGRTLARLATLEGRSDDVIELANGHHIHSAEIWSRLKSNPELIQYQLVQRTHDRFELEIAATDEATYGRLAADLVERLRPVLGPDADVQPKYVDALGPFGTGKRRQVVSHVTRPELAVRPT